MYNTDTLSALGLSESGPISTSTTKTLPTIQETSTSTPAPRTSSLKPSAAGASRRSSQQQYRFNDVSASRRLRRIKRRLLLEYVEEGQKTRNRSNSTTSTSSFSYSDSDDDSLWGSTRSSDSSVQLF